MTGIGAIILVIGHTLVSADLASEVIIAADPDVDDSFAFVDKILANKVASVRCRLVSVSRKLAVSVLSD